MIYFRCPLPTSKLLCCGTLLLLGGLVWLSPASAQPPRGADPFAPGAAPAAGANQPAAAPVAPRDESLVILQLRDSNPKTADELLRATRAVINFGRPDEAKRYLTNFIAGQFAEDELAPLPGKYGSGFFVDLGNNAQLQPEGLQVATLVMNAARNFAANPARLAGLVKSLSDPNYEAAAAALTRLEQAGPALVTPILQALADPSRSAEHPRLLSALIELRASTEAPLLGTLASGPEPMQVIAAQVLGHLESRDAVRHLLAPAWAAGVSPALQSAARNALTRIMGGVPSKYESERYLLRQFDQLRDGQHPFQPDADNRVRVWQWDAATAGPVARSLLLQDAIRQLNARLATDLVRMDPQQADYQRLKLLYALEYLKAIGGVDVPLAATSPAFAMAKEAGVTMTAEVLDQAMAGSYHPAAIAAAEILGTIGSADLLAVDSPVPGVMSTALVHADRRIRLAAALAIANWKPSESFNGASHVTEVLADAVKTAGVDRVLILDARTDFARTLVGQLADQGYFGDVATNSREGFRAATSNPDYELILVSDVLDLPPTEMVQLLRRDRRTAFVPIGVMIGANQVADLPKVLHEANYRDPIGKIRDVSVESVAALLADDRRTLVGPQPASSQAAAFFAAQVRLLGGRKLQSREERLANGRAAMAALQTLAADKELFNRFNLLRHEPAMIATLANPTLLPAGCDLLATIASPKAQTALVDVCSQPARPLADRQAALKAFASAVGRRGILLTKQQILDQYERYNLSETLDKDTQAVLSGVLDVLESRRTVAVSAPDR